MAVDIIALSSEASDFIANEDVSKGSNSDVPTTSYVNGTSLGIDSETWEVELEVRAGILLENHQCKNDFVSIFTSRASFW